MKNPCLIIVLLVSPILLSSGCMTSSSMPTSMSSSSPEPMPTTPPSTAYPTPTTSVSVSATGAIDLVWANPDKAIFLGRYFGPWSPIADELVLTNCARPLVCNDPVLYRASAPDFPRIPIDATDFRWMWSVSPLWSRDGQSIVFTGRTLNDAAAAPDDTQLWIMEHDGTNPHPLTAVKIGTGQWIELIGWMDDRTLAASSYAGGGGHVLSMIDIDTGHEIAGGQITSPSFGPPNQNYIFATGAIPGKIAVAFGRVKKSNEYNSFGFYAQIPIYESLIGNTIHSSTAIGWQPGTNTLLLSIFHYLGDATKAPPSYLALWNLDTGEVKPYAPGNTGEFAPNGRSLVYVTLGMPTFDASSKPVIVDPILHNSDETRVLNLMDWKSGETLRSVPVVDTAESDAVEDGYFSPVFRYSPDGAAVALVSPPDGEQESNMLLVISAATGETLASVPAIQLAPVWSPDSRYVLYWADDGNVTLLDVASGRTTPVTRNGGIRILSNSDTPWSPSGRYLSLAYYGLDGDLPQMWIVPVETP